MSLIESIRAFLRDCPLLEGDGINIDYLGANGVKYAILAKPGTEVVKTYVDGGEVRQFLFDFVSREAYGSDFRKNMENSSFYEAFAEWLREQNRAHSFPALGEGWQVLSIEVLTSGYLFMQGTDSARYQIQCKMTYYQGG